MVLRVHCPRHRYYLSVQSLLAVFCFDAPKNEVWTSYRWAVLSNSSIYWGEGRENRDNRCASVHRICGFSGFVRVLVLSWGEGGEQGKSSLRRT
jgi:hypothetical protein